MKRIFSSNLVEGAILAIMFMLLVGYEAFPQGSAVLLLQWTAFVSVAIKGAAIKLNCCEYEDKEMIKNLILLFVASIIVAFAFGVYSSDWQILLSIIAIALMS